ncbi:MAG: Smr/MutS family protein [Pseudomonadota bacterium]
MSGKPKNLTPEDRILWGQVAKTVDAFPGRMEKLTEAGSESQTRAANNPGSLNGRRMPIVERPEERSNPARPALYPIDRSVYRKLARGRVPLEARIDLHGMTQSEAHDLLLGFLIRAHGQGLRHVLVITGKGRSGGEGVLRRSVPKWLTTHAFRGLASGCEPAARGHGGDGALYIRLKKRPLTP